MSGLLQRWRRPLESALALNRIVDTLKQGNDPSHEGIAFILRERALAVPRLHAILEDASHWQQLPDESWNAQIHCLRSPDGTDMGGKLGYRDISKPERLVFIVSFSDEAGPITRHPLSHTWPLDMLSTVTFAGLGGRTTITMQWVPVNATDPERATFETNHDSRQMGWTGTFDQLADYLAKA